MNFKPTSFSRCTGIRGRLSVRLIVIASAPSLCPKGQCQESDLVQVQSEGGREGERNTRGIVRVLAAVSLNVSPAGMAWRPFDPAVQWSILTHSVSLAAAAVASVTTRPAE